LAKRTEKPAQGSWWFPGGRIRKGETWQECAKRKGKEELGIDLPIGNIISIENYFADDADWHTVNLVVHAYFSHRLIELDDTHEEFRWVNHIEDDLHICVKNPLSIYGFK
jgi:colanic acid biosynthesis protein WcaH